MEELLIKVKNISDKIILALKNEEIEECLELVEQRSEIIKKIEENYNSEKIDIEDYGLISTNKIIEEEVIKLKAKIKMELSKLNNEKKANSIYGKQFQNIYFLNKQI